MRRLPIHYLIAIALATTLSVVSGLAYGFLDGRWVDQPDVQAVGAQLNQVPKQLGDWSLVEERELGKNVTDMLRCYGYSHHVYQHAKTGSQVVVAVVFGPRGPIAVHTPEICYSGQGIDMAGKRAAVAVGPTESGHELWQLTFLSKIDQQPALEVHYGWSDGGKWRAAEQPRFWLTDKLYKIQVAGPATPPGKTSESLQFLELYIASLQPLLAPSR